MMTRNQFLAVALGTLFGIAVTVGIVLWTQGPSAGEVRKTVISTVQEEAQASFYVTGTLDLQATVTIDSTGYATPEWLTAMVRQTQPSALSLLAGRTETTVRVPGRVSYGFDVRTLTADRIGVGQNGFVQVDLPPLQVYSVEPDLARLEVQTASEGWMRLVTSEAEGAVRRRALAAAQTALRDQALRHLDTATQPRVNTARSLEALLTPALTAAGVPEPSFRMRIGETLVLEPEDG